LSGDTLETFVVKYTNKAAVRNQFFHEEPECCDHV
jgi:hypothetical protein